jgi:DNA-binding GntR family transcriptional regulator
MAPDRMTHDRVYRAIKESLMRGEYAAGEKMGVPKIADALQASRTPVREVFHRLIGEGIFEQDPEGGYRLFLPDARQLHDLYFWNAQHLLSAVHITQEAALVRTLEPLRSRPIADDVVSRVSAVAQIFQAIADATGNWEFSSHIRLVNERLVCIRIAEATVFTDLVQETQRLLALGRHDVQKNVRRKILTYHRRRFDHLSQLIAALGGGKPM